MASEEYASRINTPHSATFHHKAHSNHSQTHVASPLRKASFPVGDDDKGGFEKTKGSPSQRASFENALESETEDESIHVNAPTVRKSKYGGNGYDPPTEDLGPHGGNTEAQGGWIEETGYGVPILASDEVAKEQGTEYQQPAISPPQERRGSNYYAGVDSDASLSYQSGFRRSSRPGSASNSRPTSRPGSRPGSIHGGLPNLSRFTSHDEREDMHTPLEDVEEYEPLFPDEEGKENHPNPAIERLKRQEMMKRRFPSQDIWEDTPNSLQLQATVTSPETTEETLTQASKPQLRDFETPEAESARKGEVPEAEKAKLIPKEERLAKSHFKPQLQEEMRPGLKQRFPSRDIWEDSPDSSRLETTVDRPQDEDNKSPVNEALLAGAVVQTSGRPTEDRVSREHTTEGITAGATVTEKPSIPPRPNRNKVSGETEAVDPQMPNQILARPPRRLHQVPPAEIPPPPMKAAGSSPTEARKGPILPDRPKPQVPARPNKPTATESSESIPLSKTLSSSSTGSAGAVEEGRDFTAPPLAPKPKPAIPARPGGGKIAALKAGFMSDLNKQLQLGPQGPKPQSKPAEEIEKEEEKAPLADARKGRARGPARRKPQTSSNSTSESMEIKADVSRWTIQDPWTVWHSDGGIVNIYPPELSSMEEPPEGISIKRPEAPTPLTAMTAHEKEPTSVLAAQSVTEALPNPDEVAPVKRGDIEAEDLDFTEAGAPTATGPPETSSASSQTGEKTIVENPGLGTEEKLTAYLGGEAQASEAGSTVGNVIVKE